VLGIAAALALQATGNLYAAKRWLGLRPGIFRNVTAGPGLTCDEEEKAVAGKHLAVYYSGWIDRQSATGERGLMFDTTKLSQTFNFLLGSGMVIQGWERGLPGLCKGTRVTLVVPPELAYGSRGYSFYHIPSPRDIPADATLRFDVEIVNVSSTPFPGPDMFSQIDLNLNGEITQDELEAFFERHGKEVPDDFLASEDENKDGAIQWEEFSGPKRHRPPPKVEL